mmetsp:Transcript_88601/g.271216  ORF Transcript_88601/g.271216 Transcript_88601/m.271216 type:complete len:353 (-) Transcript_88601:166-1224(-)
MRLLLFGGHVPQRHRVHAVLAGQRCPLLELAGWGQGRHDSPPIGCQGQGVDGDASRCGGFVRQSHLPRILTIVPADVHLVLDQVFARPDRPDKEASAAAVPGAAGGHVPVLRPRVRRRPERLHGVRGPPVARGPPVHFGWPFARIAAFGSFVAGRDREPSATAVPLRARLLDRDLHADGSVLADASECAALCPCGGYLHHFQLEHAFLRPPGPHRFQGRDLVRRRGLSAYHRRGVDHEPDYVVQQHGIGALRLAGVQRRAVPIAHELRPAGQRVGQVALGVGVALGAHLQTDDEALWTPHSGARACGLRGAHSEGLQGRLHQGAGFPEEQLVQLGRAGLVAVSRPRLRNVPR